MFFSEPPKTRYDLHFQIAGFPVRVHPLFWLVTLVLGAHGARNAGIPPGVIVLIWVGAVSISILVHELGHAFSMRYYGESAIIVLYMLGGLAIPESLPYSFGYGQTRNARSQIVISAAGPAAGFLLALLVVGVLYAIGGGVNFVRDGEFIFVHDFPFFWGITLPQPANPALWYLFQYFLFINVFWGLINLLPIYPLDGGHIAREILVGKDPGGGMVRSLWLSVFAAGILAAWGIFRLLTSEERGDGLFLALMFGSLAYSNYQILQQYGRGGFGGGRQW